MTGMGRVYSAKRILGLIARGKFRRTLFSLYANRQVRRWQRENRRRLKAAERELAIPGSAKEPSLGIQA
jgi:hypothetical protein